MSQMKGTNTQVLLTALLFVALLLPCSLALPARAQEPQSVPGGQESGGSASGRAGQAESKLGEKRITPEQAKALFASVDEILRFASKDTGLPIKHKVRRKLASREEVQKYIEDRIKDDEDTRRLERSEVVLKKFALVPEQFDLRTFLVGLLKEQVAGFYDSKRKTVFLLDWVEPEAQKAVLAHELTHALQDQNFNLEKWAKETSGTPVSRPPLNGKAARSDLMEDERMAARQAVSEGQATIVLIDYILAPEGQSVRSNPAIADAMMAGMMSGGTTPLYTKAPLFLKELLMFPYQRGLKFEIDVLRKSGTEGAFAGAFRSPPSDTRQILEPETYISKEQLALMPVPDFETAAGKDYRKYDLSVMGQFDVWLLTKQYAGQKDADAISPNWRGGYYYAALKPGAPKPANGDATVPTSSIALAYASKWANAAAAKQFAAIYAGYVGNRYAGVKELETADGAQLWNTDQGQVSIETRGETMLVMEGFDKAAAGKIRNAVFAKAN